MLHQALVPDLRPYIYIKFQGQRIYEASYIFDSSFCAFSDLNVEVSWDLDYEPYKLLAGAFVVLYSIFQLSKFQRHIFKTRKVIQGINFER